MDLNMSRVCFLTKKRTIFGNHRSHAMNATKRKFFPNLHRHKFWDKDNNRFVKIRLSAKAIKTIKKKGISYLLEKIKNKKK